MHTKHIPATIYEKALEIMFSNKEKIWTYLEMLLNLGGFALRPFIGFNK